MHRRYLGVVVAVALLAVGLAPAALASTPAGLSPRAKCTITGTSGDDVLRGTPARDVICGLAGDDRILGFEGHDVLVGGPGDDRLVGGPGNDTLVGGRGDDTLVGGPGSDTTRGGTGADQIATGSGTPVPEQSGSSPQACVQVNALQASGVASTGAAAAAAVAAGFQLPIVDQVLFNALVRGAPTLEQRVNGVVCAVLAAPAPPSSVRDLRATATSSATVRLEWSAPASRADGVAYLVSGIGNIVITGTTAEISGLSPLTAYGFSVTAVNSAGASTPASVSVTTHAAPPPAASGAGDSRLTTTNNVSTGITARMQWNANSGYCGETSFITALLRNGGYTSQWTARSLAADGNSQENPNSQLMIGANGWNVSDLTVADSMRLVAVDYDNSSETDTDQFLAWIKQHVVADDTVIIGVYNNVGMLSESGSGDATYDHIVPVVGVGSNQPLSGASASTYYSDDIITISDNGLYTPVTDDVPGNSPENPTASALYTFNVDDWQNYRAGANAGSTVRDLYSAPILIPPPPTSSEVLNWGTAITGIIDESTGGPAAIPVQLTPSLDGEGFHNQDSMSAPPAPSSLSLTAHARPTDGVAYNVYIYEDFDDVPRGNFNAAADAESREPDYTIPSDNDGEWSQTIVTDTSQTRIFRIVPVTAP